MNGLLSHVGDVTLRFSHFLVETLLHAFADLRFRLRLNEVELLIEDVDDGYERDGGG